MADHYGTSIVPARVYRPKDKAKVENTVLIVQRWILARLRNRQFFSLQELERTIRELVDELNARPFKRLPGNRFFALRRTGTCLHATAACNPLRIRRVACGDQG